MMPVRQRSLRCVRGNGETRSLRAYLSAPFEPAAGYATYIGAAPIDASSGLRKRHRLNPRGNRMLNHALRLIAITRLRYPDTEGRIFYERKLTEGRTRKEAIRALKRRPSNVVYRHLTADQER